LYGDKAMVTLDEADIGNAAHLVDGHSAGRRQQGMVDAVDRPVGGVDGVRACNEQNESEGKLEAFHSLIDGSFKSEERSTIWISFRLNFSS
jgi:hypothetical protein